VRQARTKQFPFAAPFRSRNSEKSSERDLLRVFDRVGFRICECFGGKDGAFAAARSVSVWRYQGDKRRRKQWL
jgi:hypothetical protein